MSAPKRTPPVTPPGHQTISNSTAERVTRYPKYSDVSRRRNTFHNFPKKLNQSTDSLDEAGFFYLLLVISDRDCVWCFSCGGSLNEWKSDDDPWIEHARWYPSCHYVQGSKGQQYVKMVHQIYSPQPGESNNRSRKALATRHPDPYPPHKRQYPLEIPPPPSQRRQTVAAFDEHERRRTRPNYRNSYRQYQYPQRYHPEGKTNDGHFSVIPKMKKMGFDIQVIQSTMDLLQRTHGSADISTEEVINLILDAMVSTCSEGQSRARVLPSLDAEKSVLENDGSPSNVPYTCSVQQVQNVNMIEPWGRFKEPIAGRRKPIVALEDDRKLLILPSDCSAQRIKWSKMRCENDDIHQRITNLENACSNYGEHQSTEGDTVPDYDNISPEPQGTMVSPQLSEVDDNSDASLDTRESPAILSVKALGYNKQIIQTALQRLQRRNSKVTAEALLEEIFEKEPDVDQNTELQSIREENNKLKEQMKCKICMVDIVCISFLPCGHLCCCAECATAMVKCPICRQIIRGSVKTYLS